MRYKRATITPGTVDNRCFQYPFVLTLHYKEIKNHPEQEYNIKPFLSLYNWMGLEHTPTINKNNYTVFEKNNPQIVLVILYVDVNVNTDKVV